MQYRSLSIYLGSKCNANCTYCHRDITGDVPLSKKFLQNISENKELFKVNFFGGEPTLYISEIKAILDALPKDQNILKWISSNGLLLNNTEIVDFLIKNNIILTISYDGSKGLRNYPNIFDDPVYLEQLKKFDRIDTSTTIFGGNILYFTELLKEFDVLSQKTNKEITCYPHFMHSLDTVNKDPALLLTEHHINEYIKQYKQYVSKYLYDSYHYGISNLKLEKLNWHLETKLKRYYIPGETICTTCNGIKTDTVGNVYYCLYKRDKETFLGTVFDIKKDIISNSLKLIEKYSPQCLRCTLYPHCGCACILSKTHNLECHFYKTILPWYQDEVSKYIS